MRKAAKETLRRLLPRAIRRHRIIGGPLRGHAIVTSWHDYPAAILGRTEGPLLDWLREHAGRGETWLDVGAHFGYTALALSRFVGPEGRVFAFEPMVATAGCIAQSRNLNGITQLTVIPMGLAQPESFATYRLPTTRGMADSTVAVQDSNWFESIPVARLDWLWQRICGPNPKIDGIKIDVQGMEFDAIRGMEDVLLTFEPKLVIEFHRGVDRRTILQHLAELGYRRPGVPIEPMEGEVDPRYLDDRSYAFQTGGETR
jgi:FkbM family methyltransferase